MFEIPPKIALLGLWASIAYTWVSFMNQPLALAGALTVMLFFATLWIYLASKVAGIGGDA